MHQFGFVMEQALGHVTHQKNLARWVEDDASVQPNWMLVPEHQPDLWERLPGVRGNWSLRGSLRASKLLRENANGKPMDALFLHTQTISLFAIPYMKRIPSIVSLDATPLNYDTVGAQYDHKPGTEGWLESRKREWNRATFVAAKALVTWCQWAKDSLVTDYGIAADKVTVIPPGVDMARWQFGREKIEGRERIPGPLRLLFVGGDWERKGGPTLLEAFRSGLSESCALDIVTKNETVAAQIAGLPNARVHCNLPPNSDTLIDLYANADLFVFPTRGDCLPIAVMEAMAAGLPVIATDVGALREEVEEGVNGLIVPPDDPGAVIAAVCALSGDAARRQQMARASREMAETRFDACRNYNRILSLMKQISQ